MNEVILVGNLVKSAEMIMTKNGKAILKIEVKSKNKGRDGEIFYDEIPVTCFESLADTAASIAEGTLISVSARLKNQKFEIEGEMKSKIDVVGNRISILD